MLVDSALLEFEREKKARNVITLLSYLILIINARVTMKLILAACFESLHEFVGGDHVGGGKKDLKEETAQCCVCEMIEETLCAGNLERRGNKNKEKKE